MDNKNNIRILKNAIKFYNHEILKRNYGEKLTKEEYMFWNEKLTNAEDKLESLKQN